MSALGLSFGTLLPQFLRHDVPEAEVNFPLQKA